MDKNVVMKVLKTTSKPLKQSVQLLIIIILGYELRFVDILFQHRYKNNKLLLFKNE